MLQMRRSRGAFSGFLLILLGLWGALIPFVGPYFHFAYTPDKAWTYNTARLWLEILPGAAVFLGGFLLMIAKGRHAALFGAMLAAAAGAWFTLGPVLSPLWNNHVPMGGSPASTTVTCGSWSSSASLPRSASSSCSSPAWRSAGSRP